MDIFVHIRACFLRWTRAFLVQILMILIIGTSVCHVDASSITPAQLKAVMLVKFTDFITWPATAFNKNQTSFIIGILGSPEMFKALLPLSGRLIEGRPLVVRNLDSATDEFGGQLLYIGTPMMYDWNDVMAAVRSKPVLTVSDDPSFISKGGIIRFFKKQNGRMGFAINRSAQLKSGLNISSSLLGLAEVKNDERRVLP